MVWKWVKRGGSLCVLVIVAVLLLFVWPGCARESKPQVIEKRVEVTVLVEKEVPKEIEITKIVEKPVTVVVEKKVEVTVTLTPGPQSIALAARQDTGSPALFDGQSTGKEFRASYDIGVKQSQVGIIFGYGIVWEKNASGGKGCGLVWLKPGWYEKLTITDGRYEIYDLPSADLEGWIKVLVEQRASEQAINYGCSSKTFNDVPVWNSDVPSPPSSVTSPTPAATATPTPTSKLVAVATPTPKPTLERRPSKVGEEGIFKKGEPVVGFKITLASGEVYTECYFEKAPEDGKVLDGVVNPWPGEIKKVCK